MELREMSFEVLSWFQPLTTFVWLSVKLKCDIIYVQTEYDFFIYITLKQLKF